MNENARKLPKKIMHKNFYSKIRPILILLLFLGFHPISNLLKIKNNSSALSLTFLSFPSIYSFFIHSCAFALVYFKRPEMHNFQYLFLVFQYIHNIILGIFIIFSLPCMIRLVQELDFYDINVMKHKMREGSKSMFSNDIIYIVASILFICIRSLGLIVPFILSSDRKSLEFVVNEYSLVPLNLNIFLYLYFCNGLQNRFQNLNKTFEETVSKRNLYFICQELGVIRLLHLHLIKCQRLLEKFFKKYFSAYIFLALISGLLVIYNELFFPGYILNSYIAHIAFSIILIYSVVKITDSMLNESFLVRRELVKMNTSKLKEKYRDEIKLFLLQIEILIAKSQRRNALRINRELFVSFALAFVMYFITVIQLAPEINHMANKYFNLTVSNDM